MSEAKPKRLPTSLVIIAVIIALVIGVVAGYFIKPIAPAEIRTETIIKTATIEKTFTVTTAPPPVAPKYLVYFCPHAGMADPFWATQIKMAEEAGKLLPELKVVAAAPEAYDPKKQAEYIDAAIAAKATAIIFTLSIPETLDPVLRKAHAAGIKLICINIEDYREPPEKLPYITYIGMDERISGTILAENLYAMFKEKLGRYPKRAVIGIHQPGLICLEMRADGILGVSKKYGVPNEKVDVTMDPTKVYETIKAYITTHPDTEAIFTLGPCGSHPVEKLIGDLGKAGVIFHGCIDLSPEVISAIEKGITQVAISQQPGAQAFYSVYVTYAYLKYGIIPPELIPTGPTVVTLKNLDVIKKQIETTGGA